MRSTLRTLQKRQDAVNVVKRVHTHYLAFTGRMNEFETLKLLVPAIFNRGADIVGRVTSCQKNL